MSCALSLRGRCVAYGTGYRSEHTPKVGASSAAVSSRYRRTGDVPVGHAAAGGSTGGCGTLGGLQGGHWRKRKPLGETSPSGICPP
jgi:hypothetical protein